MMPLQFENHLPDDVAIRAIMASDVTVRASSSALWEEIAALGEQIRAEFGHLTPGHIPPLEPARRLYKSCGVDPTRRRPASEALFRRLHRGKDLYRINNAVDVCNFCSLSFVLPIGLYDLDRIEGQSVTLRLGLAGEGYRGLGKDHVGLDGHICLVDREGPFGHPSADSFRTGITDTTRHLLWVIYAPADYDADRLETHRAFSMEWLEKECGGKAGPL